MGFILEIWQGLVLVGGVYIGDMTGLGFSKSGLYWRYDRVGF